MYLLSLPHRKPEALQTFRVCSKMIAITLSLLGLRLGFSILGTESKAEEGELGVHDHFEGLQPGPQILAVSSNKSGDRCVE